MVTAIRKTALLNPLPGLSPNPREELGQRVSPHTACCRPMVLLMLSSAAGCAVKATLDVSCGYLHPMRAHLQVEKRSMNKHSGLPHLERTIQRRLIGMHSTQAAISWWVLRWRPVFGGPRCWEKQFVSAAWSASQASTWIYKRGEQRKSDQADTNRPTVRVLVVLVERLGAW
jgi:hypothetical protein